MRALTCQATATSATKGIKPFLLTLTDTTLTPLSSDGILNELIDLNIGEGNQDESTHVSSHGHKRNDGDGLLNGLVDVNIGGGNQAESVDVHHE